MTTVNKDLYFVVIHQLCQIFHTTRFTDKYSILYRFPIWKRGRRNSPGGDSIIFPRTGGQGQN